MTPQTQTRTSQIILGLAGLAALAVIALSMAGPAKRSSAVPSKSSAPPAEVRRLQSAADAATAAGDIAKARAALEGLVAVDPSNAVGWLRLGQLALNDRKAELAVSHFEKAAALDPKSYSPYNGLSTAYRMLGDDEKAEAAKKEYELRNLMFDAVGGMGASPEPKP